MGIKHLKINKLFALVGGSIGGGIAWEMIAIQPKIAQHFVPIATDWKATDWVIANCFLQEQILYNSKKPIEDARIQAMLCYRTPQSFTAKFNRTVNEDLDIYNIESWLQHHGNKLEERFELGSYKMMNHLLKTLDITRGRTSFEAVVKNIEAQIHMIGIDSDLFFTATENKDTYQQLLNCNLKVTYKEIVSVHGHDSFLIEYQQLNNLLEGIF